MENRGEISHATVKEFDEASKGKHLPEHVNKSELEKFDGLVKAWGAMKLQGPKMQSPKQPTAPSMKQTPMQAPKQPKMALSGASAAKPVSRPDAGFGKVIAKNAEVAKDDKPHPAGGPEASAHEVVEHGASLPKMVAQMNRKGNEATHRFFNHLRTLKDKSKMRSPENVMKRENKK